MKALVYVARIRTSLGFGDLAAGLGELGEIENLFIKGTDDAPGARRPALQGQAPILARGARQTARPERQAAGRAHRADHLDARRHPAQERPRAARQARGANERHRRATQPARPAMERAEPCKASRPRAGAHHAAGRRANLRLRVDLMNDAKPDLTIVLELEPPLSATIVKLAREYRETPRQTAHRLLFAALVAREGLALFVEAIELLAAQEPDDEEQPEGR